MATKIAVTGATGRLGRQLVDVLAGQGVEAVFDLATGPSPDEKEATEFFTKSTRNLQEAGVQAGVKRIVLVSIIGVDRFETGYNAAKLAQERAALAGPIPTRIV